MTRSRQKFDQFPCSFTDVCSHERSVFAFAASVQSPKPAFWAISVPSWDAFTAGRVRLARKAKMGIDCPMSARGSYYLRTGAVSPYALGRNGLRAN